MNNLNSYIHDKNNNPLNCYSGQQKLGGAGLQGFRSTSQEGVTWTQISGPEGSNDGGWYEKPTGERYYVKFYENPSQGKAEFVANAIYEKLGIKAARSEIIQLDGREAIASPAVPGATPASMDTQKNSEDVRKGFVADAFLANWDVVGLVYDNIIQGEDGLYRIDNGGSLIFRAQGGDKVYSSDSIPELQSMLVPGRSAGEVFAGITEEEIGRQARELISKLSPEDIEAIVEESGLKGDDHKRILTGLLGRREYLAKTYGEPELVSPNAKVDSPRKSVSETIRTLINQEMEHVGEILIRPRAEIICDHDHIEGQRIDVIFKKDRGTVEFRFKLRAPTEEITAMKEKFNNREEGNQIEITTPSGAILRKGKITYEGTSSDSSYDLCDAFVFERDGLKVFIADPTLRNGTKPSIIGSEEALIELLAYLDSESEPIQTAKGLVEVEAPVGMGPEMMEHILGEILEKDLGIPDALEEVPEEAERRYKIARYKWHHMIAGELTPQQVEQAEKLDYEEAFPGYTILVERGKCKEYLGKYGEDMRAVHDLSDGNAESIYGVLTQGLMCTTERYSRGAIRNGMSSHADIDLGGADSVFTRIANRTQRKEMDGIIVVLKPEVFDRTDWYSYPFDNYGSTYDKVFAWRYSPDEIFDQALNSVLSLNEQMFRIGIGANFIEAIEVASPHIRSVLIAELRSMGLEEVNGKSINEVIVSRQDLLSEITQSPASGSGDSASNEIAGGQWAEMQALMNDE